MNRLKPSDRFVGVDPVVSLLGIESLLKRRPARLSGGEKQRVAIGRALLCSPQLLLMDEPLASLDQARKEELLPYIRTLSTRFRIPILYVSHQMEEIACMADYLVRLENGRVTEHIPVSGNGVK
jgi:molybdate transport system ATP-binding protein